MSKTNRSTNAKKVFTLYATLNWIFGLWPLLRNDHGLKFRFTIGVIQTTSMMVSTLYEIFQNCGNAEDLLDSLLVLATAVISLSTLISYHIYRDKLKDNIVSVICDWSSIEMSNFRDIMTNYERIYKKIIFAILTGTVSSAGLYCIKVFIIDPDKMVEIKNYHEIGSNMTQLVLKKRYLFPATCTFNNVPKAIYRVLVINQFLQLITCAFVIVGSNAIFFMITIHLCGQFKILKLKFSSMNRDTTAFIENMGSKQISILISRHQKLLHLTKLLEDAYNKIVLTQLLSNMSLITVGGFSFLINLKRNDFFGSVKSFAIILNMLVQSFIFTSIGEALQTHGDDITQSVYDSFWYELPQSLSKDLVLVMMRSNISPCLTAGKFFNMTRTTFMFLLKTSSSYLSVLRIMINE